MLLLLLLPSLPALPALPALHGGLDLIYRQTKEQKDHIRSRPPSLLLRIHRTDTHVYYLDDRDTRPQLHY